MFGGILMATPVFDLTAGDAGGQVESWEELWHAAEESCGVLRVVMWLLRDLEQAGRLGVHVRASISRRLDGLGLAHLPLISPVSSTPSSLSTSAALLLPPSSTPCFATAAARRPRSHFAA